MPPGSNVLPKDEGAKSPKNKGVFFTASSDAAITYVKGEPTSQYVRPSSQPTPPGNNVLPKDKGAESPKNKGIFFTASSVAAITDANAHPTSEYIYNGVKDLSSSSQPYITAIANTSKGIVLKGLSGKRQCNTYKNSSQGPEYQFNDNNERRFQNMTGKHWLAVLSATNNDKIATHCRRGYNLIGTTLYKNSLFSFTSSTTKLPYTSEQPCAQPKRMQIHHKARKKTKGSNRCGPQQSSVQKSRGPPLEYVQFRKCDQVCWHCGAKFWKEERLAHSTATTVTQYHKCCLGGKVVMHQQQEYSEFIKDLYKNRHFIDNIRPYNQMFSITSFGAKIDDSVNRGSGPYVFRISGQVYHNIGSLCPEPNERPRFLQLYIYDTDNEVVNRLFHFDGEEGNSLKKEIVEDLIKFLENNNTLVQLFRTARNKYMDANKPEFKVRLYNVIGTRHYELPTAETIGAIVFEEIEDSRTDFDIIIEQHS